MKSFIKNTGYTRNCTPTLLYGNKKKDIHNKNNNTIKKNIMKKNEPYLFFYFPIRGVFKITCVPCADNYTNITIKVKDYPW